MRNHQTHSQQHIHHPPIIFPIFNRESKRVASRDGVIGRFIPSSGSSPTSWTREFFLPFPPSSFVNSLERAPPTCSSATCTNTQQQDDRSRYRRAIKYASRVIWGTRVIIPSAAKLKLRQRCCAPLFIVRIESMDPETRTTRRLRFNRTRTFHSPSTSLIFRKGIDDLSTC